LLILLLHVYKKRKSVWMRKCFRNNTVMSTTTFPTVYIDTENNWVIEISIFS
jgi:hypothetical protein